MYSCPHCGKASFSGLRKWLSSAFDPAKCVHCGGLSYVPVSTGGGILVVCITLAALVVLVAVANQSLVVALAGCALVVAVYVWLWHEAKMGATSLKQAAASRRFGWLSAIIVVLLSAFK